MTTKETEREAGAFTKTEHQGKRSIRVTTKKTEREAGAFTKTEHQGKRSLSMTTRGDREGKSENCPTFSLFFDLWHFFLILRNLDEAMTFPLSLSPTIRLPMKQTDDLRFTSLSLANPYTCSLFRKGLPYDTTDPNLYR